MPRLTTSFHIPLLLLPLLACGDDLPADTDTDTASATSTGDDCPPGHEGCMCVDGDLCLAGLACASDVCVDLGEGTGTTTDTGGGPTGKDSEPTTVDPTGDPTDPTTGGSPCIESAECADDEVCVNGICGSTDWYYFDVHVDRFEPPVCGDGYGGSELYYDYHEGGVYVSSSSHSTCPGGWPLEAVYYDSLLSFQVAFWEADAVFDDFIVSLCWGDPCGPVPPEILHTGAYAGFDESGDYYLELRFIPEFDGY